MIVPDEVLTPKEAARILRLNLETVRRLLREGLLPGRKVGLRQWRIRRVDLDEYLRSVPTSGRSEKDRTDGH
jgi:excisionase family DNA binding protein